MFNVPLGRMDRTLRSKKVLDFESMGCREELTGSLRKYNMVFQAEITVIETCARNLGGSQGQIHVNLH